MSLREGGEVGALSAAAVAVVTTTQHFLSVRRMHTSSRGSRRRQRVRPQLPLFPLHGEDEVTTTIMVTPITTITTTM